MIVLDSGAAAAIEAVQNGRLPASQPSSLVSAGNDVNVQFVAFHRFLSTQIRSIAASQHRSVARLHTA